MNTMIIFSEDKGGVAKSNNTSLCVEILRVHGADVSIYDADMTNKSTKTLYPEARSVDLTKPKVAGTLVGLFHDTARFKVMDVGAGFEAVIKENFGHMKAAAKQTNTKIITLRPVNLNVAVHKNISDWVEHYCDGETSTAIMMRSVACGRDEEAFERRWNRYEWKANAIAAGLAREMFVSDLGAEYAENQQTIQTPLAAIVAGQFRTPDGEDAAAYRAFCETVYDRDARLHIGIWLQENGQRLIKALSELGVTV